MDHYDRDGEDDMPVGDYQGSDGLEIALPQNAETYRLLTGEDPESNPKVETFREAYDRSMMESDDHSKCMEAGRKALEGEGMMSKGKDKGEGMGGMMGGGENPLNGMMG